ncbi:MAG: hypothetical protein WB791_00460 [Waddliaceae bacterium]
MELPALLPKELAYTSVAENDQNLLNMLVNIPQDLVVFFTHACDDETWSKEHAEFMQGAMQWMTHQFYQDKLLVAFAEQAVASIHRHYSVLMPCIPHNLTVVLKEESMGINGMLWGASSDFLRQKIREECRDQQTKKLQLREIPRDVFHILNEFISTGSVEELWRKNQEEILAVIHQAFQWDLMELVHHCEMILKRYIDKDNVKTTLLMAHREGWIHLKEACKEYLNEWEPGVHFGPTDPEQLSMEFFDFRSGALKIFDSLCSVITHLIIGKKLTEDEIFADIVNRCPQLICLNISESNSFSDQLFKIPQSLQELDASKCFWLTSKNLPELYAICPNLTRLNLASNQQITYSGWAVLRQWERLEKLDISRCIQVNDEDFKVILRACPHLTHLNVEECTAIADQALREIGTMIPQVIFLNLARSNISDASLVDLAMHCRDLVHVDLSRCLYVTDEGVAQAVRHAPSLQTLVIARSNISQETIRQLQKMRSSLRVFRVSFE